VFYSTMRRLFAGVHTEPPSPEAAALPAESATD